jgi:hypothetical protein
MVLRLESGHVLGGLGVASLGGAAVQAQRLLRSAGVFQERSLVA